MKVETLDQQGKARGGYRPRTHGKEPPRLYKAWQNMKFRCLNPTHPQFKDYGGRGITICAAWLRDYVPFRDWSLANGWRPGLHLDRRDNDDGYHPGNCRFVPRVENANNTRTNVFLELDGRRLTLAQWARELGVRQHSVRRVLAERQS
jgi:hypothetical protein